MESSEYYNKIANGYNELHGEEQKTKALMIKRILLSKKKLGDVWQLLDIGGGTGITTTMFTDLATCTLIDPAKKMLEKVPKGIIAKQGIAERLPALDNFFDAVIALTSLHHTDVERAISEIKRVTKPQAIVIVSFLAESKKLEEFRLRFKKHYSNAQELRIAQDILFIHA